MNYEETKIAWDAYRAEHPEWCSSDTSRARTAQALGLSEAASLTLDLSDQIFPLRCDVAGLLAAVETLGTVRGLTQTPDVVIEAFGAYTQRGGRGGKLHYAVGETAHLLIFSDLWRYVFVFTEFIRREDRTAIAFFDAQGHALHKVFLQSASDRAAFARLCDEFRTTAPDAAPWPLPYQPRPQREMTDAERKKLSNFWDKVAYPRGTADVLRSTKLTRRQTLECAPPALARPVALETVREALTVAHVHGAAVSVGVRHQDAGLIHNYQGTVHNLRDGAGVGVNIIDPLFHLHLRADDAAEAWLIRKTTDDATFYGLELLNRAGDGIAAVTHRANGATALTEWFSQQ